MKFIETHKYIKDNWLNTVKIKKEEECFSLPYEFVAPCKEGSLTDLYYWDTFFTNKGLYIDGFSNLAYKNIQNLKYCLNKFKCVPNMCRANGADFASQPPLLFLMIKDYFHFSKDMNFLEDSYQALKTEYSFWMNKRITITGLNRYGTNIKIDDTNKIKETSSGIAKRINIDLSGWDHRKQVNFVINRISEGESGEDHTPRFNNSASQINPIDLNSHLYGFETSMAEYCMLLNNNEQRLWKERALKRKKLIDEYCLDRNTGIYFDYNYINKKKPKIFCAANYLPFMYGLTADKAVLKGINDKLLKKYGVLSCEYINTEGIYQWGYPNTWAPHNYYAFVACLSSGLEKEAYNIANKFLYTVAEEFERSGRLWEKYDAVKGGKATINEYGTPEMLGWTAGIYNYFYNYINKLNKNYIWE